MIMIMIITTRDANRARDPPLVVAGSGHRGVKRGTGGQQLIPNPPTPAARPRSLFPRISLFSSALENPEVAGGDKCYGSRR